jgi:hypothetical protein
MSLLDREMKHHLLDPCAPHYQELTAKRQTQERNVEFETSVRIGHPVDQILKRPAKQGADLFGARAR